MFVKELLEEATAELESEKKDVAKEVLKSRIVEIGKAEKMLTKLKNQYQELLNKSIDDVADGVDNDNIRF